jgi:hypothetical protein
MTYVPDLETPPPDVAHYASERDDVELAAHRVAHGKGLGQSVIRRIV